MTRTVIAFQAVLLTAVLFSFSGCQSLNEDQNNKSCWFPSFQKPGHLDSNHEYYTPEGSDPYMNTSIGPRSLNARPQGYDMPRDWARQCAENRPASVKISQ